MDKRSAAEKLGVDIEFIEMVIEFGVLDSTDVEDISDTDLQKIANMMYELIVNDQASKTTRRRARAKDIESHGVTVSARGPKRTRITPPPYIDLAGLDSLIGRVFQVKVWDEPLDIEPKKPHTPALQRLLLPLARKKES